MGEMGKDGVIIGASVIVEIDIATEIYRSIEPYIVCSLLEQEIISVLTEQGFCRKKKWWKSDSTTNVLKIQDFTQF